MWIFLHFIRNKTTRFCHHQTLSDSTLFSLPIHLATDKSWKHAMPFVARFVLSNEFVFECYTFTDCYQLLNYHYLLTVNFVAAVYIPFLPFLRPTTFLAKFQFARFFQRFHVSWLCTVCDFCFWGKKKVQRSIINSEWFLILFRVSFFTLLVEELVWTETSFSW